MIVHQHEDAADFLVVNTTFLLQNEDVNGLQLGMAIRLEKDPLLYGYPPLFLSVQSEGKTVLTALQTPPHNLILAGREDHLNMSPACLVDYLVKEEIQIPGMIGPKQLCLLTAKLWTRAFTLHTQIQMDQRVYRLEKVNPIPLSSGRMRLAVKNDIPLVTDWLHAFSIDIHSKGFEKNKLITMVEQIISRKMFYVWEDAGCTVSMAGVSRPTANGITVNYVYTPPEYRSRGYATSCIARLSQGMLEKGYKFCTLFTDLNNPTSNKIYSNIGYQPVIDFVQIGFITPSSRKENK